MKIKITIFIISIVLLTSCTPQRAVPAVTESELTTNEPSVVNVLTETPPALPVATEISTAIPTPTEVGSFAERANTYSGPVMAIPSEIEKGVSGATNYNDYPTYWAPNAQGEYRMGVGSWKTSFNTPETELDIYGESFPPQTMDGRENANGTLTMINPETGDELTFAGTVFIPGFGEISLKEVYDMQNQNQFGRKLIDALLSGKNNITPNDTWYKIADASPTMSVYMAGFRYGEQNHYYSTLSSSGSSGKPDIPNQSDPSLPGWAYREVPTNSFAIPVFSPETGKLMLWINAQQGNMVSTLLIRYSEDGTSFFDTVSNANPAHFGDGGQDEFAILIENRDAWRSHSAGGSYYLLQGGDGIGDVNDIERIINAKTEQDILDIIREIKIFILSPFPIALPER